MKRKWWIAALVVAALAAAMPFFPADLFKPPIQRALERGLGRKVDIEAVHFTLFPSWTPSPGLTLDNVTIYDDSRAGIEPFAFVESLGASVRLFGLLKHKLEFSSLNITGQSSINLVKTSAGPWNFQYLLAGAAGSLARPAGTVGAIPALRMRGGRVNFKYGDTKSVFFFDNADLDVVPGSDGSVELRFGGAPERTDHAAHDFGRLFINGTTSSGNRDLNFRVALERSSLEETLRLFDPRGFDIQGSVALDAQLSGPPTQLNVTGGVQIGGSQKMPFSGALDLRTERLELSTATEGAKPPVTVHLNVRGLLSAPDWDASAELAGIPAAPLLTLARNIGIALPEKLAIDGSASGSIAYTRATQFSGHIGLEQASITLPDTPPLTTDSLSFDLGGEGGEGTLRLNPVTLHIAETRTVDLEGSVALSRSASGARALDLKFSTKGLPLSEMRSLGMISSGPDAIPLLEHATQGVWRGTAQLNAGQWTGESEILDARIPVDGLADPVQIKSAAISLNGKRASITKLRAKAGSVNFTGEYRWERGAARPHRFGLVIAEADAAELERLLAPALVRQRGFFARTLGLGKATLPEWLATRRAEGTIAIDTLTAAETKVHGLWARVLWDGGTVHLLGLNGRVEPGSVAGDVTIDLSPAAPQFHFEGELRDVAWRGGRLDLEGILDAEGTGAQLLETARAEGHLRGRTLAFAPDSDFRAVSGDFQAGPGPAKWKFSNLEVAVGTDTLTGTGASQSDGKIVLDLSGRGRQVRYAGTLLASGTAP